MPLPLLSKKTLPAIAPGDATGSGMGERDGVKVGDGTWTVVRLGVGLEVSVAVGVGVEVAGVTISGCPLDGDWGTSAVSLLQSPRKPGTAWLVKAETHTVDASERLTPSAEKAWTWMK